MSERIMRPSFGVATGVMVALVGLGVARNWLLPKISAPPGNALQVAAQEYLQAGSRQPVQWSAFGPDTLARARRLNKPILLVIGTPWSTIARQADAVAFSDLDVARYLNSSFLCVRADATADPRWLNAFLPLSRVRVNFTSGFQAWLLDPAGRVVILISRQRGSQAMDRNGWLNDFVKARGEYERILRDDPDAVVAGEVQASDASLLAAGDTSVTSSFAVFTARLRREMDLGAFRIDGITRVYPSAMRLLLMRGDVPGAIQALDATVFSPLMDWVDGGFFHVSFVNRAGVNYVHYDKITSVNAEMAATYALAYRMTGDSIYRTVAKRAFDSVIRQIAPSGLFSTCVPGDALAEGRSPSHSFPPARLRQHFSIRERTDLAQTLSLNVDKNWQMTPYAPDRGALRVNGTLIEKQLAALREVRDRPPGGSDEGNADVQGTTIARLLDTARLLQDEGRLQIAVDKSAMMGAFFLGADVSATPMGTAASDFLGDGLAYADSVLSDYLATGRIVGLESGRNALQRTLRRFSTPHEGAYFASRYADDRLVPPDIVAPEVADNLHESCMARTIRLCYGYGVLFGDTDEGKRLLRVAKVGSQRYAGLLCQGGPLGSGLLCASIQVSWDAGFLVTGRDANRVADELLLAVPSAFSAAAIGDVRRDIQRRGSGIYLVGPDGAEGPLTRTAAIDSYRRQTLARMP